MERPEVTAPIEAVEPRLLYPVSPHVVPHYYEILRLLGLSARVVKKEGTVISEGEKFTIRFTATNRSRWRVPYVVFLKPHLYVRGTSYARPVQSVTSPVRPFPDERLYPGESTYLDIEFEALLALPGDEVEYVAYARVCVGLDLERFFYFCNYLLVRADIEQD